MNKYASKVAKYGCAEKVRHPNQKTANEALVLMRQKASAEDIIRLVVYKCGDHYHVGRKGRS